MIDLARLRRLCEAATPGPWRAEHHTVVDGHEDESGDWSIISETKLYTPDAVDRAGGQTEPTPLQVAHIYVKHIASEGWPGLVADAEFIAALNPVVVVALLDRIEGAEAENRVLRERLAVLEKRLEIVTANARTYHYAAYGDEMPDVEAGTKE